MTEYRRHEVVTGIFVLAALALLGAFAFKVGAVDPREWVSRDSERSYAARFADAGSLAVGARVTVAGLPVGLVTGLRLVKDEVEDAAGLRRVLSHAVEVEFRIDEPAVEIAVDTAFVELVRDGFLGTHFLRLFPGELPGGATEPPGGGLLAVRAEPDVVGEARDAVAAIEGVARALGETMPVVQSLLRNVARLADPEDPGGLQQKIVAPVGAFVGDAHETLASLRATVEGETLPALHDTLADLKVAFADGRKAMQDLDVTLASARAQLDDGDAGVKAILADVALATEGLRDRLDGLTDRAAAALEAVEGLGGAGRALVVDNRAEVGEALHRLRRSLWQAELALRKIRANPGTILWGDEETDFEAAAIDASRLREAGRAPPFEQRAESDR